MEESLTYDVIIIGSGCSGSAIANELTREGVSCLMLEAGKHHKKEQLPLNPIDSFGQMTWGGGLEMDTTFRNAVMRGKGVGGGTVVYQAIMYRFDEYVYEFWREKSGISDFTVEKMQPWYEKAEALLSISQQDERYKTECARIFHDGLTKLGFQPKIEMRAQKNCHWDKGNDCIECYGGCKINGKQGMPDTVLKSALKQGLKLIPEFEVKKIEEKSEGWMVHGEYRGNKRFSFNCRKLVLGAGPLGNIKLLEDSGFKKRLPSLGQNFYVHTQWTHFGLFDQIVDAHKGVLMYYGCTDTKCREMGIKFENIFMSPAILADFYPGYGRNHQEIMRKYRHLSCIESAVQGRNPGSVKFDKNGIPIIDIGFTDEDKKREKYAAEVAHNVLYKEGAKEVVTSPFSICPHHFGGLNLGVDGETSCIDPEFRLHGFRNLYCADSSAFPASCGLNPALTILALSIKASQNILKEV